MERERESKVGKDQGSNQRKGDRVVRNKSGFAPEIVGALLFFAAFGGWIANIIKLATSDAVTGLVILRAIGIFIPPLGAILGFV